MTQHWLDGITDRPVGDGVHVVVDASLGESRSVSLLRVRNGPTVLFLTPERADALSMASSDAADPGQVATRLMDAGITLNDPDHIFYLAPAEQKTLLLGPLPTGTRRLTTDDRESFDRFAGEAPAEDLDEAFVELDHWLVCGTFVDGRLAAAASMYPWDGSRLADLGVITLPEFRGRGLARATVRAMSALAIEQGYEPQYRCQLDNAPSVALATAAGFTLFGDWEVVVDGPSG